MWKFYDWADAAEVKHEYNLDLVKEPSQKVYDASFWQFLIKFDSLRFRNLKHEKNGYL
jgi:hypothetical protein